MIVVPASMAQSNRRTLVRALQRLGSASRADLAKELGMSQPTVGKIVEALLMMGLIEEVKDQGSPGGFARGRGGAITELDSVSGLSREGAGVVDGTMATTSGIWRERLASNGRGREGAADGAGRRRGLAAHGGLGGGDLRRGSPRMGRPGRLLRLDGTRRRLVGIELGVTRTRVGLLALEGGTQDQWTVDWETGGSTDAWLRSMADAAKRLRVRGLRGAVMSVPGIVDEGAGRVLFSPNLHWTEGEDWPALLRRVWGVSTVLVQEERALALGHQVQAGGDGDFLLVDFGDGVGGAMVVGGQLYTGPLPLSGELGHTPVLGNRRRCGCGAVGCVESLVSQRGLLRSFAEARGGRKAVWAELAGAIEERGLPPWLKGALDAMATVIAGALNVLGLRSVVLTGSLTELPATVSQYLSDAIVRGAMWARFGAVRCATAPRRRAAGFVAVGLDKLLLPENRQWPAMEGGRRRR
jgi:predicted NBD/HSP70 family sugar kinase/DNA-binding transcriptional ArsR family regulator